MILICYFYFISNNDSPSNFRATRVFSEALEENSVTGLSDVDTREISKIIRD